MTPSPSVILLFTKPLLLVTLRDHTPLPLLHDIIYVTSFSSITYYSNLRLISNMLYEQRHLFYTFRHPCFHILTLIQQQMRRADLGTQGPAQALLRMSFTRLESNLSVASIPMICLSRRKKTKLKIYSYLKLNTYRNPIK